MTQIAIPGTTIYPASLVEHAGSSYFFCRLDATGEKRLGVSGDLTGFAGQEVSQGTLLCPCSAEHAVALRARLPWLSPVPLGRQTSFGFGDRMGSATAGHIQAMRSTGADATIGPIYAQQSCARTPAPAAHRSKCSTTPCGASFKKAGAHPGGPTPIM
jgi:hypothetical protein